MEEVLCKDCKWYCTAIKDEPFCNHHHIELVQSGCFEGERKVKTNADHIRSMTDEELARVFTDDLCELLCHHPCTCDSECESHMLTWLKQECKS